MTEFRVVIEGLDLDEKTTMSINDSIQKVVLSHLADQNLTEAGKLRGLVAFRPRPEWWGLVATVVPQPDLGRIVDIDERIGRPGT
jgi:hypothetical protein